jgi:hypothetical protein
MNMLSDMTRLRRGSKQKGSFVACYALPVRAAWLRALLTQFAAEHFLCVAGSGVLNQQTVDANVGLMAGAAVSLGFLCASRGLFRCRASFPAAVSVAVFCALVASEPVRRASLRSFVLSCRVPSSWRVWLVSRRAPVRFARGLVVGLCSALVSSLRSLLLCVPCRLAFGLWRLACPVVVRLAGRFGSVDWRPALGLFGVDEHVGGLGFARASIRFADSNWPG